jgi:hypothetical protein
LTLPAISHHIFRTDYLTNHLISN